MQDKYIQCSYRNKFWD